MSARTTRVRLFAAATVALAAFSLTACEDGSATGVRTSSSVPVAEQSTAPTASTGKTDSKTDSETDSQADGKTDGQANGQSTGGTTQDNSGSAGSQSASKDDDSDDSMPGDCSAKDVRITASTVSSPINHLLLTATSTGSKTCALPTYPAARFGEAQSVPPVVEESQPQALTMLEPGGSAYAGVLLSAGDGSADNGRTENSLTIPFDDGSVATVTLPSGGVHIDDSLSVTYWLTDSSTALTY